MKKIFFLCVMVLGLCVLVKPSNAQEFQFSLGAITTSDKVSESYTWQIGYEESINENLAWNLSWLNEGHVPDHHRDGPLAQLWARTNVLDRRLSLGAGLGLYKYFDTTRAGGSDYQNLHGWGNVFSLRATWYAGNNWFFHVKANRLIAYDNINTSSVMFGLGYQLQTPERRGPLPKAKAQKNKSTNNEITMFVGGTITNSFNSELGKAKGFEYRRGLFKHLDWTVSWMNEGDTSVIRRNGIMTQIWPTRTFFDEHLAISMGFGAYFAVDEHKDSGEDSSPFASGLITMSASYRFSEPWLVRVWWNRTVTGYDRDTDIITAGLGYRY